MGAIDIGGGAADYDNASASGYTRLDTVNAANDTGTLDTIEVWFATNGSGVKVGTFYGSLPDLASRDSETLGDVTAGSKQTFTGLSCDVATSDVIGWYVSGGTIETNNSGGDRSFYKSGDQFGAGEQTYTEGTSGKKSALYGTGATPTALPVFDYHYNNMRS